MTALEARAGMATLEARGLAYTRDGQQILSRVSVSVHPGERLAITGPSGSGKTSLLTLLAGLDTPSSGEVYIDGIRLTGVAGLAGLAGGLRRKLHCPPVAAPVPLHQTSDLEADQRSHGLGDGQPGRARHGIGQHRFSQRREDLSLGSG